MMYNLEGRVALVTGAARGIGYAVAKTLAGAGAAILLTDVLDEAGKAASERLCQQGFRTAFRHQDVTDENQWETTISECEATFGSLDILVNNAGVFLGKSTSTTTLDEFRKVQQVNVDGVFLGIKHGVPAIAKRASQFPGGGAIVNMSSIAAMLGTPDSIAYSTSKGAVRTMTKVAAVDCGTKGMRVRVNSVHPGVIQSDMGDEVFDQLGDAYGLDLADMQQKMLAAHPIGRLGTPQDVANVVLFLASDAAGFATGAEFVVDGGMSAI